MLFKVTTGNNDNKGNNMIDIIDYKLRYIYIQ